MKKQVYQFIENIKSDKALFFYRGGTALYALMRAMEIKRGNEVILQSFTCPAVPSAIVRLGATPIYADIDPDTFGIDPHKLEEKITEKTQVIIVQHTFGIPAEMDKIVRIAHKHNLRIIEDCCHAFGSKYSGQEVGSFGDAAIYSFGWYKPVVLGVGGATVINDPDLKQKAKKVLDDFVAPPLTELLTLYIQYLAYTLLLKPSLFWPIKGFYHKLGRQGLITGTSRHSKRNIAPAAKTETTGAKRVTGKKMLPFQQRRLFRKLDNFGNNTITHQKWLISQYEKSLLKIGYKPLELDTRFESVFYKYPLLFDSNKSIFEKAPQARVELSNMFVSPLYPPWREKLWKSLGYQRGQCPISEDISDRIVALPIHDKIRARDIERTMTFLASFQ
jgi:perosamine synthetase